MNSFHNIVESIDSEANETVMVNAMIRQQIRNLEATQEPIKKADISGSGGALRKPGRKMGDKNNGRRKQIVTLMSEHINTEQMWHYEPELFETADVERIRKDQIRMIETISTEVEAVNNLVFQNVSKDIGSIEDWILGVTTTTEKTCSIYSMDFLFLEWFSLMKASEDSSTEFASMLLDRGANVNLQDRNGWTALMFASAQNNTVVVKLLLDRGADVNLKNKVGESALMRAVVARSTEVVTMLLEAGADVDLPTEDGWSTLMFACHTGDTSFVKAVLDRGVNVNHQTKDGLSALMIASDRSCAEISKMLLDRGADVHLQNKVGESAFSIALELLHPEVVKLLSNKVLLVESGLAVINYRSL